MMDELLSDAIHKLNSMDEVYLVETPVVAFSTATIKFWMYGECFKLFLVR